MFFVLGQDSKVWVSHITVQTLSGPHRFTQHWSKAMTSPLSTAVIHSHCHLIRHYQSITDVSAWNQRLLLCQPITEQNPLAISVLRCAPANQWPLPITSHIVRVASYEFKCGRYFQDYKSGANHIHKACGNKNSKMSREYWAPCMQLWSGTGHLLMKT